ncbi:MAG: hypothetical protein HY782_10085 [Chloroflexi bacterium]|nr:hypothetical protein [Chloroflexota bacterium]
MPKKTRKMKQRAAMRRTTQVAQAQESEQAGIEAQEEAPVRMRPTFSTPRPATTTTFDYSHIYSDLKRIALFAGFFFAVLIILSFVIK